VATEQQASSYSEAAGMESDGVELSCMQLLLPLCCG